MFKETYQVLSAGRFIVLDESGCDLGMSQGYGRALTSERAYEDAPFNRGTRVTLLAAIGLSEVKAATFGAWHLDGVIFLQFVKEQLVPELRKGDIVVMDNLSTHKVKGVKEAIEGAGAQLVYLPAYSPDLSPVELCWSKIKSYMRKKAARTLEELTEVIKEAFQRIEKSDLRGWFKHCGYCID